MAKQRQRRDTVIGAVDAGSNAIRATVAKVSANGRIEVLARKRAAVRLGHQVFTEGHIPPTRATEAAEAFGKFGKLFRKYDVSEYRAVATSAVRNASNRRSVLSKIRRTSGLQLTTISGSEEARLVRGAVLQNFPKKRPPQLIADLGGGSLELSLLDKNGELIDSTCLPVGTVRVMEDWGLSGRISTSSYKELRRDVRDRLDAWRPAPRITGDVALCGGNARAWTRITPSSSRHGLATINACDLKKELRQTRRMGVTERKETYGVRTDRAEVMAIAGVVFRSLSAWLDVSRFVVPSAGLLDGVVLDMAAQRQQLQISA